VRRNSNGRADTVPLSAIRHILSVIDGGEQWEIRQVIKTEINRVHRHGVISERARHTK
jgi:hypothetical protein